MTRESATADNNLASGAPSVAVIITTFNHAHYLADAISSVLSQTVLAQDILIVDDGSTDHPETVVAQFPNARIIRKPNGGLSSARNFGLGRTSANYVIFLDADDRLLPEAISSGLECIQANPDAAFVYGGHRLVSEDGRVAGPGKYDAVGENAHESLLAGNLVAMHATVLYRRSALLEAGGFDESLRRCEDYDLYLRLASRHPIATYPAIVAEYRKHDDNMSNDHALMLSTVLRVLDMHQARLGTKAPTAAIARAKAIWREYYAEQEIRSLAAQLRKSGFQQQLFSRATNAVRWSPGVVMKTGLRVMRRGAKAILPAPALRMIQRLRSRNVDIPLGKVRFGDLKRLTPISLDFGQDRGKAVDRYYVERFLTARRTDIAGRVLEVGDNAYTLAFGSNVTKSEVVHVNADNPMATYVGDISDPTVLPESTFDCIVLTQTLHLIYDMRAAVAMLHRALKPGGVLLLTSPGISQVDRGQWGDSWYWSLTAAAARRLAGECFGERNIEVKAHGNVYAATAFLYGLALEEVDPADLDVDDPSYPVIVTVRAVKAGAT